MAILNNEQIARFQIPGISHQTLAGPEHGIRTLEMWRQTVAPGTGTPMHRHDCEEVILVVRGSGRLTVEGVEMDFGADTTLQVPRNAVHQIVNTGQEEMLLIAALGQSPVQVYTPDQQPIQLPWQA